MNKKFGFTLAEILIALTVVGIVSAITVPTLMNKSAKKTQAAMIQKTCGEISDAVELYMNDKEYKSAKVAFSDADKIEEFLTTYFRVNKNCGSSPTGECLSDTYGDIHGNTGLESGPYIETVEESGYKCIQNKAGASICVQVIPIGQTYTSFYVDTNGTGEPNIKGRDVFSGLICSDGTIEDNDGCQIGDYEAREYAFNAGCVDPDGVVDISGCLGKLMNDNWVMNY